MHKYYVYPDEIQGTNVWCVAPVNEEDEDNRFSSSSLKEVLDFLIGQGISREDILVEE